MMIASQSAHFWLAIYIVLVVFVATLWSSLCVELLPESLHCYQTKKMYPIYKKLESIVTNDRETALRCSSNIFTSDISRASAFSKSVVVGVC